MYAVILYSFGYCSRVDGYVSDVAGGNRCTPKSNYAKEKVTNPHSQSRENALNYCKLIGYPAVALVSGKVYVFGFVHLFIVVIQIIETVFGNSMYETNCKYDVVNFISV